MKIEILELAAEDLLAGRAFYEKQADGIGTYFLETLIAEIESLRLHGGIHRRIFGYHRLLSRRFPFAIYYKVDGDLVSVWRVLDCRRDPSWTTLQLRPRQRQRRS